MQWMPLHLAMQMPLRLASASLPMANRAVLDPQAFGDISDADSDESAERLEPHLDLAAAALRLPENVDTKFDVLRGVLHLLHSQNRQALVFTHSRPTLAYLMQRLESDFCVAVMHGGVSCEQRRRIMAAFRSGAYDFVLANRVACEGLDFEFCSAVGQLRPAVEPDGDRATDRAHRPDRPERRDHPGGQLRQRGHHRRTHPV